MGDYVIQVRKRDGEPPEIISSNDQVPAGTWTIHGGISKTADPDMPDWLYLSVNQCDPVGQYVESTRHERPVTS
jgi:hypothetical protein